MKRTIKYLVISESRWQKTKLRIDHCFALIARIHPDVDAFQVLMTTQALERIPGFVALIAGLICFALKLEPIGIGLYTFAASVVGFLFILFGFHIIPGLPIPGTLFKASSNSGISLILPVAVGFILVGWQGAVAFLIGKFAAFFARFGIGLFYSRSIYKEAGIPFNMSEVIFFNAYRLHAARLGKSTNISLIDDEMKEENWKKAFEDFATKLPESRFR